MTGREKLLEKYAEYERLLKEKGALDIKESCGFIFYEYSPKSDLFYITKRIEGDDMGVIPLSKEEAEKLCHLLRELYDEKSEPLQ
jgi:hypothetical protein